MNSNKVILITGCSSGFGLLTAVRLAAHGHIVWATMRDLSKKQLLEDDLSQHQAHATIRGLDVTKTSTIKNVVEEINKTHGRIDVLINNAGYAISGFFEDFSEEEIRSQMDTNFFGVQNVCREVIPLMRKNSQGRIINISSIAGQIASPCMGAYNASKWALEGFSESLNAELALFGILVVLVEPGFYPTKIFADNVCYAKNFENPQSPYFHFSQKIKNVAQKYTKNVNRDPEHIAKLIENIINSPCPRLRYVSDSASVMRVMIQKIMPPRLFGYIFRRFVYGNK